MANSKLLERIIVVLGFLGFFLILGTVGASDLTTELGENYPISRLVIRCGIGLLMMSPSAIVLRGKYNG